MTLYPESSRDPTSQRSWLQGVWEPREGLTDRLSLQWIPLSTTGSPAGDACCLDDSRGTPQDPPLAVLQLAVHLLLT